MSTGDIEILVKNFNKMKNSSFSCFELNKYSNIILEETMKIYTKGSKTFYKLHNQMNSHEYEKWAFFNTVFIEKSNVKLLDCAFGTGRDLIYASSCGYDTYGCELNSKLYMDFVDLYSPDLNKIVNADMRNLPFQDEFFDIIRHNASFLHMPLLDNKYTIHKCIEESWRVLKPEGYLYLLTKKGEGYVCLDTGDGMGNRPFQLLNETTIKNILESYKFTIINIKQFSRIRKNKSIEWIEIIAQKNANT